MDTTHQSHSLISASWQVEDRETGIINCQWATGWFKNIVVFNLITLNIFFRYLAYLRRTE